MPIVDCLKRLFIRVIIWDMLVVVQCPVYVMVDGSQGEVKGDFSFTLGFMAYCKQTGQVAAGNSGLRKSLFSVTRAIATGAVATGGVPVRQCMSDGAVGIVLKKFDSGIDLNKEATSHGKRKVDTDGDSASIPQGVLELIDSARAFWAGSAKKMSVMRPGFRLGLTDGDIIVSDDEEDTTASSIKRFAGVDRQPPPGI